MIKAIAEDIIPASLLPHCRTVWRKGRAFVRGLDRRTMSQETFVGQLKELGFGPDATIYLHSSMDALTRRVRSLTPFQLINLLKDMMGEGGTLLMPTFPFTGSQYHYVQRQKVFNVNRTPSQVGLVTELFRRSEGVTRSFHPTHPVAAWGRHSKELVAEHHLGTAFGEKSPVYKMRQYDGLMVGLGVTPRHCFTLYHVAEELHPTTYAMQYSPDSFEMTIVHAENHLPYKVIPLRHDLRRRYGRADRTLQKEGILSYFTVQGLEFSVTNVGSFLSRSRELIDANMYYGR